MCDFFFLYLSEVLAQYKSAAIYCKMPRRLTHEVLHYVTDKTCFSQHLQNKCFKKSRRSVLILAFLPVSGWCVFFCTPEDETHYQPSALIVVEFWLVVQPSRRGSYWHRYLSRCSTNSTALQTHAKMLREVCSWHVEKMFL